MALKSGAQDKKVSREWARGSHGKCKGLEGGTCCCCLVTKSCLSLCNPTDCSMPGFPGLHYLPEFAQIHIQRVGDAIQPSHPLSSPSPPALHLSQHHGLSSESALHIRRPKDWSFKFSTSPSNEYSGMISLRIDWFDPGLWIKSTGLSRVFSNTLSLG